MAVVKLLVAGQRESQTALCPTSTTASLQPAMDGTTASASICFFSRSLHSFLVWSM